MCGEHDAHAYRDKYRQGSSPHVRGALDAVRGELRRGGIIPACAGSTGSFDLTGVAGTGSSPHVRGARIHKFRQLLELGIIPACAGSTIVTFAR